MKFRDLHRNIKFRVIQIITSQLVNWMVFPFMTVYLANNFSTRVVAVLLFLNVLVGVVTSFLGGYLGDNVGRKKTIYWAELVRFCAFVLMMLSNSPWMFSPTITFMMMIVNTACWGVSGPASHALLIDASTEEQRKQVFSFTYWANNLSMAIGGILGALLFQEYLFQLLIFLSLTTGMIVIFVMFYIHENYVPQPHSTEFIYCISKLVTSYILVFRDKLFMLFATAGILLSAVELQLTNYIGIRLSNVIKAQSFLFWKVDGITILGFLRGENTILVVIFALFATKITNNINDRFVLVISSAVFSIGYGVLAQSNNIPILFIFMFLLTIGEVLRIPIEQAYMASIPPQNARSTYMAIVGSLTYHIAMLIVSFSLYLGSYLPSHIMSIIITLTGLLGTCIYIVIIPKLNLKINP